MNAGDPAAPVTIYRLLLLVAGNSLRSRRTIHNVRGFCSEHMRGRFELEIVDVYQQPELARRHQVVALPTLVKLLPLPVRNIIGDCSEKDRLMRGLELAVPPPPVCA